MKNRKMRFWGLVAVLTALLSISVIGCPPKGKDGEDELPGTVSGTVRDDFEKDGYEESDPPLSPDQALRPSMRLLSGSTVITGPVDRTSEGKYIFSALPGNYTVEASCSGFVTQTKPVTIPSGGGATRNFGLQRP